MVYWYNNMHGTNKVCPLKSLKAGTKSRYPTPFSTTFFYINLGLATPSLITCQGF